MTNAGSPVKVFVENTLKQVCDGISTDSRYNLLQNIKFELSVVGLTAAGGALNIEVLSLGGKASSENIQKVKFVVPRVTRRSD